MTYKPRKDNCKNDPPEAAQLLDYFDTTYVSDSLRHAARNLRLVMCRSPPMFTSTLWNVHDATVDDDSRTNNVSICHTELSALLLLAVGNCVTGSGAIRNRVEFDLVPVRRVRRWLRRKNATVAPQREPARPIPLPPFDKDPKIYTTTAFIQNISNGIATMQKNMAYLGDRIDMIAEDLDVIQNQDHKRMPILLQKKVFLDHRITEFDDNLFLHKLQAGFLMDEQKDWEKKIRHRNHQTKGSIPDPLNIKIKAILKEKEVEELKETDRMLTRLVNLLIEDTKHIHQGPYDEGLPDKESRNTEQQDTIEVRENMSLKHRILGFFANMRRRLIKS
ncbi:hypothetical protein ScPMuIL_011622 [Solemya velum]